jgi:hypothetical protein
MFSITQFFRFVIKIGRRSKPSPSPSQREGSRGGVSRVILWTVGSQSPSGDPETLCRVLLCPELVEGEVAR